MTAPIDKRGMGRRLVSALLLAVLVASLLLAVPGLRHVFGRIGGMSPAWVATAVALELASCASFLVIFRLFFDRVPARTARRVAWTEMASGALLPGGGVGGLALGGWLMHHLHGMPAKRIVQRSSGLFFLTSALNGLVIVVAGALLATGVVAGPHDLLRTGLPALAAGALILAIAALPLIASGSRRGSPWVGHVLAGIRDARHAASRPSWRLAGAAGYLLFDIAVLWATFRAMGHPPAAAALVLAYMIGFLANVIPVPGGIGVLDSGLVGTLVLYGAPATKATAAVLVYHAIAFWIPGLGGLLAYSLLRRRLVDSRPRASTAASPAAATSHTRDRLGTPVTPNPRTPPNKVPSPLPYPRGEPVSVGSLVVSQASDATARDLTPSGSLAIGGLAIGGSTAHELDGDA